MAFLNKRSFLLFLLVTASSSLFRITNLDIIEFKIDEASNILLAARPLFGHPFPYGGILTSVGTLNPPLFNYLLFPFTLISLDPKTITLFIALANSLAIAFLFAIIKKYYSMTLAILSSLILAFSPWSILFSRKIWPPDLFLIFAVFLFFSIHKIIVEKKTFFWIFFVMTSLFLIQLEIPSVLFIILISLFVLIQKPRLNWQYILIGFTLGLLPAIPYLIYEARSGYQDFILLFAAKKQLEANAFETLLRPLQIINQGNFRFVMGDDTLTFATKFPLVYKLKSLFYIEYILIPLGMFLFWKKYKTLRFSVYTTFTLPLAYFIPRIEPFMHYFAILIPFLSIFLAMAFYSLMKSKKQILRCLSITAFSVIIIYSVFFNLSFFQIVREKKGLNGDYGASFNEIYPYLETKYEQYKDRDDFQEILLSGHIPFYLFHGSSPFARMLYPYEETEKNIRSLEAKIEKDPDDPRLIQQLAVYYTTHEPSQKTASYLKKMTSVSPAYAIIFHEVHELYLQFRNDY